MWSPATPPRFHSSAVPSAAVPQPTAAAASGTINITERSVLPVSLFVVRTQTTHYRRSRNRPDPFSAVCVEHAWPARHSMGDLLRLLSRSRRTPLGDPLQPIGFEKNLRPQRPAY